MVFIMESIMEHVAKVLRKSPEEIKFMNLYQQGQVSVHQSDISEKLLEAMWVRSSQSTTKNDIALKACCFLIICTLVNGLNPGVSIVCLV